MSTDWRKFGFFLAGVGVLYIFFVSVAADFTQVLSLTHGIWLLVSLLIVTLAYKGREEGCKFWHTYRTLQARLRKARDFIMSRAGDSSSTILLCARTFWLFQQNKHSIRISKLLHDGSGIMDVSQVSLKPLNLLGMHFTIIGANKGVRAKGAVKTCDSSQACVELYEKIEPLCEGDLAIPIIPPNATDLERLLGNVLFILSG
jgi:hypothetical protein